MIPKVHGPWVYLGRAHSAGDQLVYDLDFDELLTLWRVEFEDYLPLLPGFDRAHPNLAHITRVAVDGQSRMLASPVAGVSLLDLTRLHRRIDRRVPVAAALRIAVDLCAGYAALGEPTIGTGRPGYACIGWDGATRVCVGSAMHPGVRSNFSPLARMTFSDLSPEAIRGERGVPHWTWTVGSVLFHLLTGDTLDGEGSEFERLLRLRDGPLPTLGGSEVELPEGLAELVDAALAREPGARPTLRALADGIARFGPASEDEVADLLAHLFADQRAYIFDTLEQLRAAPPTANDQLLITYETFRPTE